MFVYMDLQTTKIIIDGMTNNNSAPAIKNVTYVIILVTCQIEPLAKLSVHAYSSQN